MTLTWIEMILTWAALVGSALMVAYGRVDPDSPLLKRREECPSWVPDWRLDEEGVYCVRPCGTRMAFAGSEYDH